MDNWNQKILTPQLLDEQSPSYETVKDLIHALEVDGILNIAVTGPYGSGKSSVLKTLMSKADKKNKFLGISLATLDADESFIQEADEKEIPNTVTPNEGGDDTHKKEIPVDVLNRKIEYSILQQLVYRETFDALPYSRLKKIRHLSDENIKTTVLYLIGLYCCISLAFAPFLILADTFYETFCIPGSIQAAISLIAIIFILLMGYDILCHVVRYVSGMRLQHVNVGGNEIEMNEEGSIFNRYLDEILYFFQCTDYNVVIIEDLDRFNTTDIFLKLRELNHLINNSKIVGRQIRFIYAVKDDMFRDSSRSKFFDYITTVIPVITTANSKDKLREALKELGHEGEVPDDRIRDIAFHIDDMRLLYNIVNEYHQYSVRLNSDENHRLDHSKMLAMIVVKNYHPHDFSLLHKREGKIYKAICQESKREYVEIGIARHLKEREEALQTQLETFDSTSHLSARDLRNIYMNAILQHIAKPVTTILLGNDYYMPYSIAENEELFNQLITQESITFRYDNGISRIASQSLDFNFSEVEKTIAPLLTYAYRLEQLQKGRDEIVSGLEAVRYEKIRIHSLTAMELILQFKIYNEPIYTNFKLSDLEDDFIRMGLIDEDYNDYISYFYPGIMTQADHDLCLDMRLNRSTNFDDRIDNVENLLRELPKSAMRNESVYNVALLDFLVQNDIIWGDYYQLLQNQLVTKHPLKFLTYYSQKGTQANKFFKDTVKSYHKELWRNISFGTMEEQNELYQRWFLNSEVMYFKKGQVMWCNQHYQFLASIYEALPTEIQEFLVTKFSYEKLSDSSPIMLTKVIQNQCYVLSLDNIPFIVNTKAAADDITKLADQEEMQMALRFDLIHYTWRNALSYYAQMEEHVLDDYLYKFVTDGIGLLANDDESKKEEYKILFQSLQECGKFNADDYGIITQINSHAVEFTPSIYELPESHLLCLVNSGAAGDDTDILLKLQEVSTECACKFIENNKDQLQHVLESITIDSKLALSLLSCSSFNQNEYHIIIASINPDYVQITKPLANLICRIMSASYGECHPSVISQSIELCSEESKAVMTALHHIAAFADDTAVIDQDLLSLGSPYSTISESGKHIKLPSESWAINLVKHLDGCKYISSWKEENGKIIVNTKRKK